FEAERQSLIAYRGPFDGFREVEVAVSKSSLVRFDHNRYSVAVRAARRTAQMRVYAERIVVWCDGEIVAEHRRRFGRGQTAYDPWHYLPVLARKPGALRRVISSDGDVAKERPAAISPTPRVASRCRRLRLVALLPRGTKRGFVDSPLDIFPAA